MIKFSLFLKTNQPTKRWIDVSFKTQILYLLVYVTRYIDFASYYSYSYYLLIMKTIYLSSSLIIVHVYQHKLSKSSYSNNSNSSYSEKGWREYGDNFQIDSLILISLMMALLSSRTQFVYICRYFSVYLEGFALLPQLILINHITSQYKLQEQEQEQEQELKKQEEGVKCSSKMYVNIFSIIGMNTKEVNGVSFEITLFLNLMMMYRLSYFLHWISVFYFSEFFLSNLISVFIQFFIYFNSSFLFSLFNHHTSNYIPTLTHFLSPSPTPSPLTSALLTPTST